jgi:transposase
LPYIVKKFTPIQLYPLDPKVISSVKSVGQKTSMTLLASLPELGFAKRRVIASLAGLAPYANNSGSCS